MPLQPCAYVEVKTIGRVNETNNAKVAAELTAAATKVLGVPPNRVFVLVSDVPGVNWAVSGELLSWYN